MTGRDGGAAVGARPHRPGGVGVGPPPPPTKPPPPPPPPRLGAHVIERVEGPVKESLFLGDFALVCHSHVS
jgi:hypothetical protein